MNMKIFDYLANIFTIQWQYIEKRCAVARWRL